MASRSRVPEDARRAESPGVAAVKEVGTGGRVASLKIEWDVRSLPGPC